MIVLEERQVCHMLEGLFHFDKECEWNDAIEEAMHRFVNLPTIEAEPVVRCKDCIWKFGSECTRFAEVPVTADDFCSRAERKRSR